MCACAHMNVKKGCPWGKDGDWCPTQPRSQGSQALTSRGGGHTLFPLGHTCPALRGAISPVISLLLPSGALGNV